MIEFGPKQSRKTLISLTPLIDVVFILLIFFMLATSFTKWNAINLSFGEPTNDLDIRNKGTLLEIVKPDEYRVDKSSMTLKEIEELIQNKLKSNPNHFVLIQAHENIPLQDLVNTMTRMRLHVGKNLSVARKE